MKKRLLLLIIFCGLFLNLAAQTPQGVNYQAVARDSAGNELTNQALLVQFSIIADSLTGNISWQETHNAMTNEFGLYNLIIGQGTMTGIGSDTLFSEVDWGKHTHFLKVEIDVGTGLLDMGTTQLLSVPYALYAETSGEGSVGEVRMFALSLPGAVTKQELQAKGWAICDGTTPVSQGVPNAIITATPDMRQRFIRMSNDESSGTIGGKDKVKWVTAGGNSSTDRPTLGAADALGDERWYPTGTYDENGSIFTFTESSNRIMHGTASQTSADFYTETNLPPYYELVYFIKVK